MTERDRIRAEELLQLMRLENNCAEHETQHGDGWLSDHDGAIRNYQAELDELLAKQDVPTYVVKIK